MLEGQKARGIGQRHLRGGPSQQSQTSRYWFGQNHAVLEKRTRGGRGEGVQKWALVRELLGSICKKKVGAYEDDRDTASDLE